MRRPAKCCGKHRKTCKFCWNTLKFSISSFTNRFISKTRCKRSCEWPVLLTLRKFHFRSTPEKEHEGGQLYFCVLIDICFGKFVSTCCTLAFSYLCFTQLACRKRSWSANQYPGNLTFRPKSRWKSFVWSKKWCSRENVWKVFCFHIFFAMKSIEPEKQTSRKKCRWKPTHLSVVWLLCCQFAVQRSSSFQNGILNLDS